MYSSISLLYSASRPSSSSSAVTSPLSRPPSSVEKTGLFTPALPPKASGDPYYFMDILQYSGLDFNRLEHPVELLLNGSPCEFTQALAAQDEAVVRYKA